MTAPTDVTFSAGTKITSQWLNGVNDHVNNLEADPHPSYLSKTEAATTYTTQADLASSAAGKGAGLVEYRGATVEAALNERLPEIGNYAALDAYTGDATAVLIYGVQNIFDGGHGVFRRTTDTPAAANGIYRQDALGRWWKRDYSGDVDVRWFGIVGGYVADDTAKIQEAIDFLPNGATLNGHGVQCVVTSLNLKSYMNFVDFRLKTKAGTSDFVAPITIDGRQSAKTNIYIRNVYIDGNRANQTNIVNTAEDGGRHGFRILGNVRNLLIENSEANYCAGDGIEFFGSTAMPATDNPDTLCFQNIVLNNVTTNFNRRHGISGDSFSNVKFINGTSRYNGLDLNTTDPYSIGTRGARSDGTLSGTLYAGPVDIEGYGVGSGINDFHVIGGVYKDSPSGFTMQDAVDPAASGFLPRSNITFSDVHFGYKDLSPFNGCFQILGQNGTDTNPVYKNVAVSNCQLDHYASFQAVSDLHVSGGNIVADFNDGLRLCYATVIKCTNWRFDVNSNTSFVDYDQLPFSITRANVAGSPTFTAENTELLGFTPNGYLVRYYASLNGAIANNYWCTFTASADYLLRVLHTYMINSSIPAAELCVAGNGSNDRRSMTSFNLIFNLTSTSTRQLEITMEVVVKK